MSRHSVQHIPVMFRDTVICRTYMYIARTMQVTTVRGYPWCKTDKVAVLLPPLPLLGGYNRIMVALNVAWNVFCLQDLWVVSHPGTNLWPFSVRAGCIRLELVVGQWEWSFVGDDLIMPTRNRLWFQYYELPAAEPVLLQSKGALLWTSLLQQGPTRTSPNLIISTYVHQTQSCPNNVRILPYFPTLSSILLPLYLSPILFFFLCHQPRVLRSFNHFFYQNNLFLLTRQS